MTRSSLYILIAAFLFTGCATTVETTMTKSWEKEVSFSQDELDNSQLHILNGGEEVTLVSPAGVQAFDSDGSSVHEVDREKFFRLYVQTTRGAEEITDKIAYIYLPHRHDLLEFNYSMNAESVTMIDLDNKEISWMNEDLRWSMERYQVAVRGAAKGLSALGGTAADAASELILPDRYIKNMTEVIPELDALLFKTLDGLKLISLTDGEELWTNEDVKGGITKMFYDSDSESIVLVNSDDEAFKLEGLQFNKQIARIDATDGSTIWTNSYDGDVREKLDGIGIWADREADIRLMDDVILINFLNVELYDFETGDQLWQTSEGANKLLDMAAPEAQIMNLFAFPVIHNEILYRVGFENVGLTGVDVIVEAFELYSGEMLWKSDKLSRSKPVNNMKVTGDKLIVSTGSSEGVMALDLKNGEKLWGYEEFGRRGVQHRMHITDEGIVASGRDKIALLDPQTGNKVYTIDTKAEGIGTIEDFTVDSESILVSGGDGFAFYETDSGEEVHKVVTPTGGLIQMGKDRMLIMPKPAYAAATYPVDGPFYIIDPDKGTLSGILGNDSSRLAWKADDDLKSIYVLSGNKIIKYEAL